MLPRCAPPPAAPAAPLRDTTLLLDVLETISVKMGDEMPHMMPASIKSDVTHDASVNIGCDATHDASVNIGRDAAHGASARVVGTSSNQVDQCDSDDACMDILVR